jgi:hypothetical protein
MRGLTKLTSCAVFAITAGALSPAAFAAQLDCQFLNATGVVTVPGTVTTTSQTFAPIAVYDMTTFSANCVHVQFTAQFRSKAPTSVQLRATVNGIASSFPNLVSVNTSANAYDERAVTFIIPSVGASSEIGIEIRSGDGTTVNVRNGLLRVQHNNQM